MYFKQGRGRALTGKRSPFELDDGLDCRQTEDGHVGSSGLPALEQRLQQPVIACITVSSFAVRSTAHDKAVYFPCI